MLWRAPCGHFRDSVPAGEMVCASLSVCVCVFKDSKAEVQLEPLKTLPPLPPASRSSTPGRRPQPTLQRRARGIPLP